jgi:hypothetical protein
MLRIFGEYIRTMSVDLHQLDDLFVTGPKKFPHVQYQATDIKAPRTPPNLNITTYYFHT